MKKILLISALLFSINANAQGIAQPTIAANGFTLNAQSYFDNQVSVLIPSSFHPAEQALINQRFGNGVNSPKVVLTDTTSRPIVSLNIAENTGDREDIIHFYRDIKNDIRAKYPTSRFLKTDVIRNRTLAIVEVIMPDNEGRNLYNMMAFRYVGDKFFFFNFSCPEADMAQWQNTAREMAENVKVVIK